MRIYPPQLLASVLGLAFAGWLGAAPALPTIEASQVNARNIGSCETYDPKDPHNVNNGAAAFGLSPIGAVHSYVQAYQKAHLKKLKSTDYSVTYLTQPRYGAIQSMVREGGPVDLYIPNTGFAGHDRYVAEVLINGVRFTVSGYIRPSADVASDFDTLCRRLGLPSIAWKIQ